MSSFQFLEPYYPEFYHNALIAEKLVFIDPSSSLAKSRLIAEKITNLLLQYESVRVGANQFENIKLLHDHYVIPSLIKDDLHLIRKSGNKASHDGSGKQAEAQFILKLLFQFSKWFVEKYEGEDLSLGDYHLEEPASTEAELIEQLKSKEALVRDYESRIAFYQSSDKKQKEERAKRGELLASKINLNELETRITLIDEMLRKAGWQCDTIHLNNKKHKTVPLKGENRAIAEWPCGSGWADYALFAGLELVGIVEAKAYAKDISTNLDQSKLYASCIEQNESYSTLGRWDNYHAPFLFSTNGRSYSEQIQTKSGVWFLDVRNKYNRARALENFYSPQGLQDLFRQDISAANIALQASEYDYLTAESGLALRPYQIEAIKAIEEKIINHPEEKKALVVMATGTGKTRTIGGLLYRLIKSNRFKRILFLTDRTLLATQARDSIKNNKIEELQTFSDIYEIADLDDAHPDLDTRLQFATVQSMVKRVFYSDTPLPIDFYDCIIVDEAHRGYMLDKEFVETDLFFTNQDEYIGQFKKLLFYFDAWKIGLTATPALHTTKIFGDPVFGYSYRDAVIDGFLVDSEPPYIIKTELNTNGVTIAKGEQIKLFDPETNTLEELAYMEDDVQFDVDQFNSRILTPTFNEAVVGELVKYIDPEAPGKTLIFAARDAHADELVALLYKKYEEIGNVVHQQAIEKITGRVYDPVDATKRFKNEPRPSIVVTVDLLTTGIDVPEIDTLVFMRAVKSRILYEQMVGRATRLCAKTGKESFRIFDAVRIYETMRDKTQMTAVGNPVYTLEHLANALEQTDDAAVEARIIDQILAKLQRKKRNLSNPDYQLDEDLLNEFEHTNDVLKALKSAVHDEERKVLIARLHSKQVWTMLDQKNYKLTKPIYVDRPDAVTEVVMGFGKGLKPDDYIESFKVFIENNRNKIAALELACTRPADLDRQSLKELKHILDKEGYSELALNAAWKAKNNVEIAADIIAYIRTLSLGSHLISKEQRVKNAIQKIKSKQSWNAAQLRWIDRFEKHLVAETILKKPDLDNMPFKDVGGFSRLDDLFQHNLEGLITELNEYLYTA